MENPQPQPLADLIMNEPARRRRQVPREKPYVELGSSDSPVTTEMLVAGRDLKSSLILCGVVSETWLTLLLNRVTADD